MALYTKKMNAMPSGNDGIRICIMRDPRFYNRHLKEFGKKYARKMYDYHIKDLSPSKELKDKYYSGKISWKEFENGFRKEMIKNKESIKLFAYIAMKQNITLLCTEENPDECHRRLVALECKKYEPKLKMDIK